MWPNKSAQICLLKNHLASKVKAVKRLVSRHHLQTLTILYIYLTPKNSEAFFTAIFTVLKIFKQILFQPKDQIFSFHLIPFASKSIYSKSLKRPNKDWQILSFAGNLYNKRSHFWAFSRFLKTFICTLEAHFLTYNKARGLIWKIRT